ncbi:MAG TPA: hypothetical protein VK437_17970, partial [Steroidobacteraceae bacterium]|nr:hypothetical protein [Steroidobacteraceae bacterium]
HDAAPPSEAPPSNLTRPPTLGGAARSAPPAPPPAAARAAGARPRPPRIELARATIEVPFTDPAARIAVHRTGNLHGAVSFTWWTESGTAKPGQDFTPVAARRERIEDGKSSVNLFVPVVADPARRLPKSFYVVINAPTAGASLGSNTLAMVTIPASE